MGTIVLIMKIVSGSKFSTSRIRTRGLRSLIHLEVSGGPRLSHVTTTVFLQLLLVLSVLPPGALNHCWGSPFREGLDRPLCVITQGILLLLPAGPFSSL